jgi:hypothetical protein
VLTLYGVASAFIFVWVPWRGYETPIYQVPKDRWNSTFLGYGLVWSQLKPPAAFVKYDIEETKYQRSHALDCIPDWKSGIVGFVLPPDKEYCVGQASGASPPPGYTEVAPPAQPPAAISPPPPRPKKPEAPDGYIPPGIYRWARLDFERVLLEFGALTGLLLVAWMFIYTGGKADEPK